MDQATATFLWTLIENLIFDAVEDPSIEYNEHIDSHGESSWAEKDGTTWIVYDCQVANMSYISVNYDGERIINIGAGPDADLFGEFDFVLEERPDWAFIVDSGDFYEALESGALPEGQWF